MNHQQPSTIALMKNKIENKHNNYRISKFLIYWLKTISVNMNDLKSVNSKSCHFDSYFSTACLGLEKRYWIHAIIFSGHYGILNEKIILNLE